MPQLARLVSKVRTGTDREPAIAVYRRKRVNIYLTAAFVLLTALVVRSAVVTFEPSGKPEWWPSLAYGAVAVLMAFLAVRSVRLSVVATAPALIVRNFFRTRTIPWHLISAVKVPTRDGPPANSRMTFVLYDGQVIGASAYGMVPGDQPGFADEVAAEIRKHARHLATRPKRKSGT